MEIAFHTVAAADFNALSVYNDYGLEYGNPDRETKRKAVLKFLERLKSRETPIYGGDWQAPVW